MMDLNDEAVVREVMESITVRCVACMEDVPARGQGASLVMGENGMAFVVPLDTTEVELHLAAHAECDCVWQVDQESEKPRRIHSASCAIHAS